ncbi:branched-chain amino acid aminotransferase 2, chloroplastic isoform X1 [Hevea brasiliensis]|uniref:branched-chain amino acid aminotransferase 2, chloroplastic isoform X1 n=1 Tax=Hevea brasiliensis TaxID=3981 RepID=UPI0025FC8CBE|nr:branched-chain amino acid aminotransferase 2, chloroplastic isoform X1 [Hevea brasiliensis]
MPNAQFSPSIHPNHFFSTRNPTLLHYSSALKLYDQHRFLQSWPGMAACKTTFCTRLKAIPSDTDSKTSELANDINWDNLGLNPVLTDYMYVMKCSGTDKFSDGELQPFGNIELNPFSSVLNYGQGIIEGLRAFKKEDDSVLLFRPEANGLRMRVGADRICMPAPTIDQFVRAVKATVSANRRWVMMVLKQCKMFMCSICILVLCCYYQIAIGLHDMMQVPPPSKGFLYIRPLLIGSGAVLSLTPSPEFIFLIYVTPVRNYFEHGAEPINLVIENDIHRAVSGGVGSINAIGNYATVMKGQVAAKAGGFHDALYLDAVHNKYLEEISAANIFVVKDKTICTPALRGTILPGITRESVIDIARRQRFQVEERPVSVEELFSADEVFCTGNAVGLLPVGSVTYQGKRLSYKEGGLGTVCRQLSSALANIQMGLADDKMGWTVVWKLEDK